MQPVVNYKRILPHKQESDSIIFLTWRQHQTLPQSLIDTIENHKSQWRASHSSTNSKSALDQEVFMLYDSEFAKLKPSEFSLTDPIFADIIKSAIHYYHKKKYYLHAFCLMPNHIHILIHALKDENDLYPRIQDIVRGLKSYTAKMINAARSTTGHVWAANFYDRMMRSETEYWNTVEYILNNPVKAGIVSQWEDYPHNYWHSNEGEPEM